jgi:signal transduction histidine kinase
VWQRAANGSVAYYGIVLAGTLACVLLWSAGTGRALAVAALAAMVPWYGLAGRRAVRGIPVPARTARYVLGLTVLLGAAQAGSTWSSLALFALCPQCFVLLPVRWATAAVAAFNVVPVLLQAGHPAAALGQAGISVACVAFAATFGAWIIRIIEQSAQRAERVAALETASAQAPNVQYHAGVHAERQRMATEIHDTLAQGFASILMLLQAADAATAPDQVRAYLGQASRTARENLAEAHGMITRQPPAALIESPLHEALARLTGRLTEETGIRASCEVAGDVRGLPQAIEVVVLRCAQEALANVRKHSAAVNAALWLDYRPGTVRLCVCDDGVGFDPPPGPGPAGRGPGAGGMGLAGMGDRVAQAGGTLDVRSVPGAGTMLTVEIPA